ncbi:MAG: ABC transporter permease [Deltaproteobacteria bacterium]|nr:ABC transporter permease [Deltaproteobacteria bacterium]MBI3075955.1 ABC transporter permease [Deltaproteobacteria bacterium]
MRLRQLPYLGRTALEGFRAHALMNLIAVIIIALAFVVGGGFLLLVINVEWAAEGWSEQIQVTAYLADGLSAEATQGLRSRIAGLPEVAQVRYVSKDDALKAFRGQLGPRASLLQGLTESPLPASFEIALRPMHRSADGAERLAGRLRDLQGIEEVSYGQDWVRRLQGFLEFLRLVGAVIGGGLLLSVIFIVSNTMALTVLARREETEILQLVGATRSFIALPLVFEGMIQGLLGALLSLGLLYAAYELFTTQLYLQAVAGLRPGGIRFLPWQLGAAVVGAGLLLGAIGSLLALGRAESVER